MDKTGLSHVSARTCSRDNFGSLISRIQTVTVGFLSKPSASLCIELAESFRNI
jgi:hypothetical protein